MVHPKPLIPSQLRTKTHLRASVIQKIFRGITPGPPWREGAPKPLPAPTTRTASSRKPGSPRFLTDRRPWQDNNNLLYSLCRLFQNYSAQTRNKSFYGAHSMHDLLKASISPVFTYRLSVAL
jgi:hypothetical protein